MSTTGQLIVILGPTAAGKTKVAAAVASMVSGEIISADSRQVYRKLDIGTGKDLQDYRVKNRNIPYHLIDICDLEEEYNLQRFQVDFRSAYDDILSRSKQPLLCGGTGLYIQSVLDQYQLSAIPDNPDLRASLSTAPIEELREKVKAYSYPGGFQPDVTTAKRLIRAIEIGEHLREHPWEERERRTMKSELYGIVLEREERRKRITARLRYRLRHGMIEEVEGLLADGISRDRLRRLGLEYKWITDHLEGRIDGDELFEGLRTAIHQFAKRQMTWFRKMEREGHEIHWIDGTISPELQAQSIVDKSCGKLG